MGVELSAGKGGKKEYFHRIYRVERRGGKSPLTLVPEVERGEGGG